MITQGAFSAYNQTSAVNYARTNFNVPYSPNTNPFIDVGGNELGGNCTNFANQSISAGMLNINSPVLLNREFINRTARANALNNSTRYYYKNNISNQSQSSTWRGAQSMFSYSRTSSDKPNTTGVNLKLVTKTAYINNAIQPMAYSKVRAGDIVFDFDFTKGGTNNIVDHTAVVTQVKSESWYDVTQKMKSNNIRLTYQSFNKDDVGLGDIINHKGEGVAYVYRPV